MASPSTNCSSGSSEGGSTVVSDQKKRKRMESNRESARRARMRKQKRLDDLNSQAATFRKENNRILKEINTATQQLLNIESEKSILRAQMMELSHRLESLNEILSSICCMTAGVPGLQGFEMTSGLDHEFTHIDPFAQAYMSHPIAAAPDEAMLQY